MSRCAKCGCEKESPFDGKTVIHDEARCGSLAASSGSPLSAADFEAGCNNQITGWLWDESYSLDYQESVSLTIREMRYIANVLRAAQGLPPGVVREWSEDAANNQAH